MAITAAEARDLLLLEWESRKRRRRREEEPKYDWYGPPCGCELSREDGSCPVHHRARANQRPPQDPDWLTWLILAGRGFGKTRTGAEYIIEQARNGPPRGRYALVGKTNKDVRETMIGGESGILERSPPWFRPKYNVTHMTLTWPNGAQAFGYTSDQPAQLRGPQFHGAWGDELAHWVYLEECLSNLTMALRLGVNQGHVPRKVFTTTPLPKPAVKRVRDDPATRVTRGSTYDNRPNLAKSAVEDLERQYEGTRLGRQELHAEVLEDTPGALWKGDQIDRLRVKSAHELVRVVVAVDPSVADAKRTIHDEEKRAEAGIVVAGRGKDGHYYVLEDASLSGSPLEWAEAAIEAYDRHEADRVVAEANNGGAMVEATLRSVRRRIPYKQLWASRGKQTRAEPVAALYEKGEVHHAGHFPELESQLTTWVPGDKSPDRMDALVWAITELQARSPAVVMKSPFVDYRG